MDAALNAKQMENRKIICEILLQMYDCKSFLRRIVTGDEMWIYWRRRSIGSKTKSFRSRDNALDLVGSEARGLL